MYKLGLEKAEELEIKMEKARGLQKASTSDSVTILKPLTCGSLNTVEIS